MKALGVYPAGKVSQSAGQLAPVFKPVAKRAVVAVAFAEPAVIEHEEFDAERTRFLGDGCDFVGIKIEISRFPVVDENRTGLVAVNAAAQPGPVKPVIGTRHAAQPFAGVDEYSLRGLEGLARLQQPGEIERVNANAHAGLVKLLDLCNCREAAAVHKAEAIHISLVFIRAGAEKREKGISLMTA
ncbi:hypothetical protein D3C74_354000 [compost metagenome]